MRTVIKKNYADAVRLTAIPILLLLIVSVAQSGELAHAENSTISNATGGTFATVWASTHHSTWVPPPSRYNTNFSPSSVHQRTRTTYRTSDCGHGDVLRGSCGYRASMFQSICFLKCTFLERLKSVDRYLKEICQKKAQSMNKQGFNQRKTPWYVIWVTMRLTIYRWGSAPWRTIQYKASVKRVRLLRTKVDGP
jgi:hypothetical protein